MADYIHVLTQPRLLAVYALLGIWGIGISVMLAHIFIVLGLMIALLSSLGIFWVYADDIKDIIINRQLMEKSRTLKELLIACLIFLSSLTLAPIIFFRVNHELLRTIITEGANLQIDNLPVQHPADDNYYFPLSVTNTGKLAALATYTFGQSYTPREFTIDQLDKEFNRIVGFERDRDRAKLSISSYLEFDSNVVHKIINPNGKLSQEQYSNMISRKAFLYTFFLAKYTDNNAEQDGIYYFASHCGIYQWQFGAFARCPIHNREKDVVR